MIDLVTLALQDVSIVSIDDDFIPDSFESQMKNNSRLSTEVPSLLSANQLLELVCDDPFLTLIFLGSLDWVLSSSHINNTKIGMHFMSVGFGPVSSSWEDFSINCI